MKKILMCMLLALPFQAFSVGLGEHTLNSYLNQPLDLSIPVLDSQELRADQVKVSVAEDFYYKQAGIEKLAIHDNLKFHVKKGTNGDLVIYVTTDKSIQEPYMNFIAKVDLPNGRLLKEVSVLLDPASFDDASVAQQPSVEVPSTMQYEEPQISGTYSTSIPEAQPYEPVYTEQSIYTTEATSYPMYDSQVVDVQAYQPEAYVENDYIAEPYIAQPYTSEAYPVYTDEVLQNTSTSDFSGSAGCYAGEEYHVEKGQTLWEIASCLSNGSNIQQTLLAIVERNPRAFISGNMNRLRSGASLTLPSYEEVSAISRRKAQRVYAQQLTDIGRLEAKATTLSSVEKVTHAVVETAKGAVNVKTSEGEALNEEKLAAAQSENAEIKSRNSELRAILEVGESSIKAQNAELAKLEAQLAKLNGGKTPATTVAQQTSLNTVVTTAMNQTEIAEKTTEKAQEKTKKLLPWFVKFLPIALILALLAGGLAWWTKRKGTKNDVEDLDGFESSDNLGAVVNDIKLDDVNLESAVPTVVDDNNIMENVKTLLAYAKEEEAIDLLKSAIVSSPERQDYRLKLAELYVSTENQAGFKDVAQPLLASSDAGMVKRVNLLANKINVNFTEKTVNSLDDVMLESAVNNTPAVQKSVVKPDDALNALNDNADDMLDLDFSGFGDASNTEVLDFSESAETLTKGAGEEGASTQELDFGLNAAEDNNINDLKFDLSEFDSLDDKKDTAEMDFDTLSTTEDAISSKKDELLSDFNFDTKQVDELFEDDTAKNTVVGSESLLDFSSTSETFNTDEEIGKEAEKSSGFSADNSMQTSVADIEANTLKEDLGEEVLSFDTKLTDVDDSLLDTALETSNEKDFLESTTDDDAFDFFENLDENETKLDLAQAYKDMGDAEGAKEILEEIIAQGNEEQRKRAQDLLDA